MEGKESSEKKIVRSTQQLFHDYHKTLEYFKNRLIPITPKEHMALVNWCWFFEDLSAEEQKSLRQLNIRFEGDIGIGDEEADAKTEYIITTSYWGKCLEHKQI